MSLISYRKCWMKSWMHLCPPNVRKDRSLGGRGGVYALLIQMVFTLNLNLKHLADLPASGLNQKPNV